MVLLIEGLFPVEKSHFQFVVSPVGVEVWGGADPVLSKTMRLCRRRALPCPAVKQSEEWGDPSKCEGAESCQYCHTRTEQQFHPEVGVIGTRRPKRGSA